MDNWHLIGGPHRIVARRESHLCQHYSISSNIRQWVNTDVLIWWHTKRVLVLQWRLWFCSWDFKDPRGYRRMDRLVTLRIPEDSVSIWRSRRFNWCVVSLRENAQYLVVRQCQLDVTSIWFTHCAYLYNMVAAAVDPLRAESRLPWYMSRNHSVDLQSIQLLALQPQGRRKRWQWTRQAIRYALGMYLDHS